MTLSNRHGFPDILVIAKANCPPCKATMRALRGHGIPYTAVYLGDEENPWLRRAREFGYTAVPVVIISIDGDDIFDSWSGYRPEKIADLARWNDPEELDRMVEAEEQRREDLMAG